MKKLLITIGLITAAVCIAGYYFSTQTNLNPNREVGEIVDSLNSVYVYYNGGVSHVEGRNTVDGYNIGLKYQCVEFVKRYYFEYYNHKMPDSYGHAKSFYNKQLSDNSLNKQRNLQQFSNPSITKPKIGDLVVFDATTFNPYGHVAIISSVKDSHIEIIQQNPGPFAPSRESFPLEKINDKWTIVSENLLGWLRKK